MGMRFTNTKPGADNPHLTRQQETWIDFTLDRPGAPPYAAQQVDARYYANFGQVDENTVGYGGVVNNAAALPNLELSAPDGYGRWAVALRATGADAYTGIYLGKTNRPMKVPFWSDVAARLNGVTKDNTVRAFVWEALLRKYDDTQLTNAYSGMFLYHGGPGAISPGATNFSDPRIGLVGDGALGFRFGSVGCPFGAPATVAENSIDANSVQPAGLIDPDLNWFLVKMKVVPQQLGGVSAAIYCYLDDTLQASFTVAATNFPRNRAGVAAGAGQQNYGSLYPFIGQQQPAAVAQRCGLYCSFVHYWFDEDLSA